MSTRTAARDRRSLTHVGGDIKTSGDAEVAKHLAAGLDVQSSLDDEDAARAHVHGFHAYPARMHPDTARRVVEGLSRRGGVVLDPFCGSGTVLIEARLAGRRAVGVDANPLAVRLSRRKLEPTDAAHREALVQAAREAAAVADDRRKRRVGASHRFPPADVKLFDPHVLLELDGLRVGMAELDRADVAADLGLVLSAILVKLSRRTSDTSAHVAPRRLAAGYPSRLFVRKAEELAGQLESVEAMMRAGPKHLVFEGDARRLADVRKGSVDLCVTSPPYPGVYDYLHHHELRLRWLGLEAKGFAQQEIGARRRYDRLSAKRGILQWEQELGPVLRAIRRTLKPGALAVFVIADSVVGGVPVYCDELLPDLAEAAGLSVRAVAAQARPHFHAPTAKAFRRKPRREHIVALERCPPRSVDESDAEPNVPSSAAPKRRRPTGVADKKGHGTMRTQRGRSRGEGPNKRAPRRKE